MHGLEDIRRINANPAAYHRANELLRKPVSGSFDVALHGKRVEARQQEAVMPQQTHADRMHELLDPGIKASDAFLAPQDRIQQIVDEPPFFKFWLRINEESVRNGGQEYGYGEARALFDGGPTPPLTLTFVGKEWDGLRATRANPVQGRPAYHGEYREVTGERGTVWHKVLNNAQLPIAYTTPEDALNAARLHRDVAIKKAFR